MGPTIISPANAEAWANEILPPNSRIHSGHRIRSRRMNVNGNGKHVILSYLVKENKWNQWTTSTTTRKWRARTGGTEMKERWSPRCCVGHPVRGSWWQPGGSTVSGACVRRPGSSCVIVIVALRGINAKVELAAPLYTFSQNNSASLQVKSCLFWWVYM